MSIDEVIMFIDTVLKGGQTLEYATRLAREMHREDPAVVDEALAELERRRLAIRELRKPLTITRPDAIAPWYIGPLEGHVFWPTLRNTLLRHGFPTQALDENVDPSSSKIVSHLAPPGELRIDTRGLVLGYIQSGKTTSFTSVIAKSADAGYRLFVVLSGMHDSLRTQTQERLERDLIEDLDQRWFNLTHDGDFTNPGNANAFLGDPNKRSLAVLKKNPARLRRLLRWLRSASEDTLRNCPIIVIDDEADQASVDVGKNRRSTINQRILDILDNPKAAYVAYTATPFANLLIDPEGNGLYPRDFVVSLPKPFGHFGTEVIFGRMPLTDDEEPRDGLNVVRQIPDEEVVSLRPPRNREAREAWSSPIPSSLAEAIRYFVLATAARRARGQREHSSMLVHTSVYIDIQSGMKTPAEGVVRDIREGIATGKMLTALAEQWERERESLSYDDLAEYIPAGASLEPVSFDRLRDHLDEVADEVEVIIDNSKSPDRLEYGSDPRVVIAIGGNTLSRGLTLEGLVVSYFVRAASAYDTLLQMGRWFGYRGGYEDLPRIWMTGDLQEWFIHLATVEEEIRTDIARYEAEHKTPRELAVRIRTHSKMTVTAKAKMKGAVNTRVSYSGERLQTFMFNHRDREELEANEEAARRLLRDARAAGCPAVPRERREGWWIMQNVPNDIVKSFISDYRFHPNHADLKSGTMNAYIDAQARRGALKSWNVVVAGRKDPGFGTIDLGLEAPVNRIVRSRLNIVETPHANIKALVSKVDRVADMPELDEEAPDLDNDQLQAKRPKDVGLLVIYPIERTSDPRRTTKKGREPRVALDAVHDVIGVGLVFPSADDDPTPQGYVAAFESPPDLEDAEAETEEALEEQDQREEAELAASEGPDDD